MDANNKKNIVVIGGGPAGIEAAKSLAGLGYTTFLLEKDEHLGGHLARWDRLFPESVPAKDVLARMTSSMGEVKWFVNSQVSQVNRFENGFNVILSNGISIRADAILLTTGFSLFDASRKEEYGYGIYDRVITNADLEDYFTGRGNKLPAHPKRIGFVHCVGSRDEKVCNRHCSKVCCATAVKQACEIKQEFPDAQVYCFYMDLRMFGRGYEDLYLQAQKKYGVNFVRGRVSEVSEDKDGCLFIKAEDTFSGKPMRITLDMLVLMAGMTRNPAADNVLKALSLNTEEDGFLRTEDNILSAQESHHDGIFYAGACTGPKTLPETLADARAAALKVDSYLKTR